MYDLLLLVSCMWFVLGVIVLLWLVKVYCLGLWKLVSAKLVVIMLFLVRVVVLIGSMSIIRVLFLVVNCTAVWFIWFVIWFEILIDELLIMEVARWDCRSASASSLERCWVLFWWLMA